MKTVEEWAQELPEDVKEKFLANVIRRHGIQELKSHCLSLSHAMISRFNWRKSPEKDKFWRNIYNQLKSENR